MVTCKATPLGYSTQILSLTVHACYLPEDVDHTKHISWVSIWRQLIQCGTKLVYWCHNLRRKCESLDLEVCTQFILKFRGVNQHWLRKWYGAQQVPWHYDHERRLYVSVNQGIINSAPRHYLNQCWLNTCWAPGNIFKWNCDKKTVFIQDNAFENVVCKMAGSLSLPQCLSPFKIQCPNSPLAALLPIMVWYQTGERPLSELMMTEINDKYTLGERLLQSEWGSCVAIIHILLAFGV